MINDTDRAHIAGLFDGEGSIIINQQFTKSKMYHNLTIVIDNQFMEALEHIQEKFNGGYVGIYQNKGKFWCGRWKIHNNEALKFLNSILQFLKIKYDEAIVAIEFQNDRHERNANKWNPLTDEERLERDSYRLKLINIRSKKHEVLYNCCH